LTYGELMPKGTLTLFFLYVTHAATLRVLALLTTSQSKSRTEYLILTDNIIVLDRYFNMTKKSKTIDRL